MALAAMDATLGTAGERRASMALTGPGRSMVSPKVAHRNIAPPARVVSCVVHAVVATAFGGPDVLSLTETTLGPVGPGQILVQVRAAGVNPADYKRYRPSPGADPSQLPMRLGFEAAGVVRGVGEGAESLDGPIGTGDEVIVYPVRGAYATEVVTGAANAVHKPSAMTFEDASGLMLAGTTAVHALHVAGVRPGDTLLLHGASGGVGLMVTQLAVAAGATVIGTAKQVNHERLRQLGAYPVVYGDRLLERVRAAAPDGVDAAIDAAGTEEAISTSLALVTHRERIVTLTAFGRAQEAGIKAIGQGPGADPGPDVRSAARVRLAQLAAAGKISVFVAATYPLGQAGEAHAALAAGRFSGKVVLRP